MKIKLHLTVFFSTIFGSYCLAQTAVLASGADTSGSGGSVSYSVGQLATAASSGGSYMMTEGVQQPFEIITLGISDPKITESKLLLYPNPVKEMLFVDFVDEDFKNTTYQLYDMQGKLIKSGNLGSSKNALNFTTMPAAVFIIKIFRDQKNIKTFKIIKK